MNEHLAKNSLQTKIRERNKLFELVRHFFAQRDILEVDTPLLREYSVTDPYMAAFSVISPSGKHQGYLQTSPEYAMKKLLCNGSGDIFQMSKMFRADEKGAVHSSEFTLLEWYRIGFDHFQLIDEVCLFIQEIVGKKQIQVFTYQQAFINCLAIDPFNISLDQLSQRATELLGDIPRDLLFDNYLTLLFSEKVETRFDKNIITVVYGFPASQASLAKIRNNHELITADRFEVYLAGMELANGFNELTDAKHQLQRFEQDNDIRRELGSAEMEIDDGFIQSLKKGLPDCAGVALGIDRLLMVKLSIENIEDVLLA